MNLLKQLLTVVAFGYLCYHIYTLDLVCLM